MTHSAMRHERADARHPRLPDEPLVSSDFRGDSRSAVVDGLSTMALDGTWSKFWPGTTTSGRTPAGSPNSSRSSASGVSTPKEQRNRRSLRRRRKRGADRTMPKRSIAEADVTASGCSSGSISTCPCATARSPTTPASVPRCRRSVDLLDRGAAVVLATHLGRPKGKPEPAFSVAPIARRLG